MISPDAPHQFIRGDQPIVISGIIYSTSSLTRGELRTITAGEPTTNYAAVKMNIEPLEIENAYRISAEIPTNFIHPPGISFWIHATNEKDLVQDSKLQTIGVKRGGGFDIRIELDSLPNQAIGTLYRPTAYVFSNDIPVYGSVSLLVNDQIVYTSPGQVFDSDNPSVVLEWKIPKEMPDSMLHGTSMKTNKDFDVPGFFELVGRTLRYIFSLFIGVDPDDKELSAQDYLRTTTNGHSIELGPNIETELATNSQISAQLNVYDKVVATTKTTLNTFPTTLSSPISEPVDVKVFTNEDGKRVANAALIYSSDKNAKLQYRIVSPSGVCFIGQSDTCLVNKSTIGKQGNMDSFDLDGQVYRIKYSSNDSPLERFTVTSIDPIVGKWDITLESADGLLAPPITLENVLVKIKYTAQNEELVTITSN